MKKHLFILCLGLCLGNILSAQEILFEKGSYKEALVKAKKARKYVFIDCYTFWCSPCKTMADKVFVDPEVGTYFNTTFVNFKQEMETGDGPALAEKYNVKSFPTFLFLDGDGNLVHKALGRMDPADFIAAAKEVFNEQNILRQGLMIKQHIHDSAFVMNYCWQLEKARMNGEIPKVINAYLEAMMPELYFKPYNWKLIRKYVFDCHSPVIQYVVEHKEDFYNVFGRPEVMDCTGVAYRMRCLEITNREKPDMEKLESFINEVKGLKMNFVPFLMLRLNLLKYVALQNWDEVAKAMNDIFIYHFWDEYLIDKVSLNLVVMETGIYGKKLTEGGRKEYNPDICLWFKELSAMDSNMEYQYLCATTLYDIIQQSGDRDLTAGILADKDKLMIEIYRQNPPTTESMEVLEDLLDNEQYQRIRSDIKRLGIEIKEIHYQK